MKHLTHALAACLSLLCAQKIVAAPDQEHVLVTDKQAPRRDSISEIDLANYTGFVQVIDRDQFEHRFTSFGDLLHQLPGIQVRQVGGTGTFNSVSIRGSSGKQVSIFLDGLLLNSPGSGAANISAVPTVLIERVEAYPDFTPVQLGNANLAGAINFRSRNLNEDDNGAQASVSTGSFDTHHGEVSAWGNIANWQMVAGLSHVEADNDFPVDESLFRTTSKRRQNDGFQHQSAFIKIGREQQAQRFSALLQYSDAKKELPSALNQQRDNATLDNTNWRLQAVQDYQIGKVDIAHRGFISRDQALYTDTDSTIGLGQDKLETETESFGLYNTARWLFGEHEWVIGLELRRDDIRLDDHLREQTLTEAERDTAVFALANNWCASDNLLISAALRHYLQDDHIDFSLSGEDNDNTISASSAQVGGQWRLTPGLTLKSNIGLLLRLPTLTEKFGAQGLLSGNPELSEEKARSADIGFNWQRGPMSNNTSVFYRKVEDAIITIYDSRGVGQPQNIGSSEIAGVETEFDWRALSWLTFKANATLLDSENHSDIRSAQGKQLPGIYHHTVGAGLTASFGQSRIDLDYAIHNDLYYDPANAVEADKKEELSVSFTQSWQNFTFDLSARNLLDENFLDANRFPTPGRSITATLTFTL